MGVSDNSSPGRQSVQMIEMGEATTAEEREAVFRF
jgi:hypothetical protein